jgi:hypothetical protein
MKDLLGNIKFIIREKGRCGYLGYAENGFCNNRATRFERWEGGDFSISCKRHHKEAL